MSKQAIAVVGRPNVGKSVLFNRLVGKKLSIVDDTPGVTRDRLYADAEWRGKVFSVIDTGGIEPESSDDILKFMRAQAEIAIQNASVIIFVCDVRTGVTAADAEVAAMLQKSKKPVVLAVNKCDTPGNGNPDIYEFYNLGLGEPFGISALHGYGVGDLLDKCFEFFKDEAADEPQEDVIRVAVIGKPNVGKSSLINKILGQERVIVSNAAGTTRDAVDSFFENEYGKYIFIDTAGVRKHSKIEQGIEKFSVMRSYLAVDRADVCVIMIDAAEGVTEQDTKIAGYAHEQGKASIIAVNKWDIVDKNTSTMDNMRKKIAADFSFMTYAPVVFISAKTGERIDRVFELINIAASNSSMRITTGNLNTILSEATMRVQPPTDKGRRLKIFYMTQVSVCPPTFVIFCNDIRLFHFSYKRYIENQIRAVFGFTGTPIRLIIRERNEKQ